MLESSFIFIKSFDKNILCKKSDLKFKVFPMRVIGSLQKKILMRDFF